MKSDLISFKKNLYDFESSKECFDLIDTSKDMVEIPREELIPTLLNSIKSVKVNDDFIMVEFDKSLILKSENIIQMSDNLNIQLAKRIHLNPVRESK